MHLLSGAGLRKDEKASAAGAQTERRTGTGASGASGNERKDRLGLTGRFLSVITGPYEDLLSIDEVIEQELILFVTLNVNKNTEPVRALASPHTGVHAECGERQLALREGVGCRQRRLLE